jgi:DNA repair protein RadC
MHPTRPLARSPSPSAREPLRPKPLTVRDRLCFLGAPALSDEELLGVLLEPTGRRGKAQLDSSQAARAVLANAGGLSGLSRLRAGGLAASVDLPALSLTRLLAALELGARVERATLRLPLGEPLTAERVGAWAVPRLGLLEHEEVWVLCVDGRTALRSASQAGRGGVHGCGLLPRDLLTPVVREAAAGFVLVHNHPSGDPTPSREDVELTRVLERAAATLGTPLLDHVVVTRAGYCSMLELGLLPAP